MGKFTFNLKKQILTGYLILIVIFLINTLVGVVLSKHFKSTIYKNTSVIQPSIVSLIELDLLVNESKNLTNHWINTQQKDTKHKRSLVNLHKKDYADRKNKLASLINQWDNAEMKNTVQKALTDLENQVLRPQKRIMQSLHSIDHYQNEKLVMEMDSIAENVIKDMALISGILERAEEKLKVENKETIENIQIASVSIINTSYVLAVIIILIGITLGLTIANRLTKPILKIKNTIDDMSKGQLPDFNMESKKDEIGDISNSLKKLINNIKITSEYAISIGEGKYDAEYEKLSGGDVLGAALLDMRDKLKKAKDIEQKSKWITQGLTKFADILRENNDDIELLCDNVITNLVKYLNATQAGIFVINDDLKNPKMVLQATYAYDRKKYIDKEVGVGEGLIGQCWQEREKIFLTDIPQNYVNITSGLGTANPTSILIVPLIINEEIYGIIEIASFDAFEDYQIDFIEKTASSIASTISSVKVNLHTSSLLKESQQMSEEMQAQEEELRQNAEEMQATQEEMERKLVETEKKLKSEHEKISSILNTCQDGILAIASNGKVTGCNITFETIFNCKEKDIIDSELTEVLSLEEDSLQFLSENLGKSVEKEMKIDNGGTIFTEIWTRISINKLGEDENSDYGIFITDITELKHNAVVLENSLLEFQTQIAEQMEINETLEKELEKVKKK